VKRSQITQYITEEEVCLLISHSKNVAAVPGVNGPVC